MEKRDNSPLSHPLQFSIALTFWHTQGFLYKSFRHCETKNFSTLKNDSPPPSCSQIFISNIFLEHSTERILYKCYRTLRQRKSTRKVDSPPSFLLINFFNSGIVLNHTTERFLYKMSRYCETKQFRGKRVTADPFLILNKLRYPKIIKHWKITLRNVPELWDKKVRRKILILALPPSLSINFFTSENFLESSTEGLLYEISRNCETKQFWWKNVITAPSLILYIFRYQKFSETKKGSLTKFSALWDEKNPMGIIHSLPPPSFSKTFSPVEYLWNTAQKGSFTKCFVTMRMNKFDGKSW